MMGVLYRAVTGGKSSGRYREEAMKLRQQLEKTIIRWTRSMNLRAKIVLFYGVIVFLPTALLAVGAGYLTLHTVRGNYMLTIEEAVRQSAQSIAFKKQSYDLLAIRTATDGELISRLSRDYADMFEQLETVQFVDRSFQFTAKYLPGIDNFRIYHTSPTLVQDGGILWKPERRLLSGIEERAWYEETLANPKMLRWTNAANDARKLVVSQKIASNYGEVYGVVYLLLDYNAVFAEPFERPFDGAGALYIVSDEDRILASSDASDIGRLVVDSSLRPFWQNEGTERTAGGMLLLTHPLPSGWTVAALVHLDRLEQQAKRIYIAVGLGIACFLLISVFLIMTVLKNMVWRIRKLGLRMTDIARGDFDVTVNSRDRDELGELELLFNHMTGQLGRLVEENTQVSLKEREQSFKTLQAQINPHFIYNSLSLVRWRAMDLQDETQIRIIDAMTTFYRLALNNTVNVTPIRDELEHVKAYLDIQQLRYPGRVDIEWEIDPDTLDLYTIKVLLQPIVENSYQHGHLTRKPGARIRIAVRQSRGDVEMAVEDNGQGIDADKLTRLRSGVGLANIRERLRLYFGGRARLEIDSVAGEGTTVTIRMPACTERPEMMRGDRP